MQEKTRAAAAPRNPKNGAVSSPLNVEAILLLDFDEIGEESESSFVFFFFLKKKKKTQPESLPAQVAKHLSMTSTTFTKQSSNV